MYVYIRTTCKELTDQIISTSKLSVNTDKVSEQKLKLSELKNSINHKNGFCGGKLSVLFSRIFENAGQTMQNKPKVVLYLLRITRCNFTVTYR